MSWRRYLNTMFNPFSAKAFALLVQFALCYWYSLLCATGIVCFVLLVQFALCYWYSLLCTTGTVCFVLLVQFALYYWYSLLCTTGTVSFPEQSWREVQITRNTHSFWEFYSTQECMNSLTTSKMPYDVQQASGKRFAKSNRQVGSALPRTSHEWRPAGRERVNSVDLDCDHLPLYDCLTWSCC